MERLIKFKQKALLNPDTYVAMRNDQVAAWTVGFEDGVYIHDHTSDNFPFLRAELTKQKASYDFFQRREGEADNAVWHHGRGGNAEIYANYGNSVTEFADLKDCKF